jgi:hypothetical protein
MALPKDRRHSLYSLGGTQVNTTNGPFGEKIASAPIKRFEAKQERKVETPVIGSFRAPRVGGEFVKSIQV